MLKLILAGAAALPVAAGATVAATGVAWVDVREGGPERARASWCRCRCWPAEVAAAFVPIPDLRSEMGEARASTWAPPARSSTRCASRPTASWCGSRTKDETVVISKEGDTLRVHVAGKNEDVIVNVPLESAAQVIRPDGRIDPSAAVRGLRHARFQTLVEVRDGDDHVKISLW